MTYFENRVRLNLTCPNFERYDFWKIELQTSRNYFAPIKIDIWTPYTCQKCPNFDKCLRKFDQTLVESLPKLNFKPPKPNFELGEPQNITELDLEPDNVRVRPIISVTYLETQKKIFCQIVKSTVTIGDSTWWLKRRTNFHIEFIFLCLLVKSCSYLEIQKKNWKLLLISYDLQTIYIGN